MIGIKDIAKAAGVSPSTVSNVLNDRKNVGEETRDKILALCEEMGYLPTHEKKKAKTIDNRTILFNFSDFDRRFYLRIIQGMSEYAEAKNYDLIVCTNKSCDKFMDKAFTSGAVTLDAEIDDNMLIEKANEGYPIVSLDRTLGFDNIKSIIVDNYTPMRELIEGLVRRYYKSFAYLGGFEGQDNTERFKALRDVLGQNNIMFKRENYIMGDYKEKSGIQAAKLLMLSDRLPDVLVCANDNMAIGAIKTFRKEGLRVPEDIAVTGFDDSELARVMGVTTVAVPNYERGYLAAQYLIENIEGAGNFETLKIPAKVKWRETTRNMR